MTRAWERSRPQKSARPRSQREGGGFSGKARSTHARARSRHCARSRLRASFPICHAATRYRWVPMATGRCRMLRQRSFGLHALRGSFSGGSTTWGSSGAAVGRSGFRKNTGVKLTGGSSALRQYTRHGQHNGRTSSICFVFLDRMPSEILLKIFSYLDAVSLLCTGCVSRRFYQLANDKISGLGWAIILKEKSGKEHMMQHVDLSLNDASITVAWYGRNWPHLSTLSTLDLCGVTPVFMDRYKPPVPNGPRWLSLIAKYDLSHLSKSTMIGCDRLVRIFCLNPGLLVGLWQKEDGLAFVIANLHFHHLVERSTFGSATFPYVLPPHSPFVDDNPEYGLQGYQLHIDMHGGGIFYLCSTFHNLFSRKGYIENGYVKFMAINLKNNREHLPLIGKVGLAWRTDIFDGFIESCSVVDVTLLDEHRKPFWCMSSPVCMRSAVYPSDGPSFMGHTYYIDYMDIEGGVHAELVWIEETEEYFIVNLVLYLSVAKINHWFGTKY
ncbi:F-box only protein 15 isoform X2 [Nannospalax galili]|uniref:F-box only protein 15 isoform X2 n=1 Tax=Nannospalax galili TaxID=1026970 RepID=UPI00111C7DDB|nr:F-box only protein 15 isoform X2 [Nannospalax galili]